jgi:hypothetical protein
MTVFTKVCDYEYRARKSMTVFTKVYDYEYRVRKSMTVFTQVYDYEYWLCSSQFILNHTSTSSSAFSFIFPLDLRLRLPNGLLASDATTQLLWGRNAMCKKTLQRGSLEGTRVSGSLITFMLTSDRKRKQTAGPVSINRAMKWKQIPMEWMNIQ